MFIPEDYEQPSTPSGYVKFNPGENRIRILSSPIMGWEEWAQGKPIRYRMNEKPATSSREKIIRHFWAVIVWNYSESEIQIWQIRQAKIISSLKCICQDKDWGDPFFYDLKVIKTGKDKDTKYDLITCPKRDVSSDIIQAFKDKKCRLEALFENEDPFATTWAQYTKGFFDNIPNQESKTISDDQLKTLMEIISKSTKKEEIISSMCSKFGVESPGEILYTNYSKCLSWVYKNIPEDEEEVPF